ncbi:MAG: glycosyltransferase family 1 protein, partial [Anaerolineae bacterium]|nr:glycosyltransferase family 1 protein [Anaerolineae bacterium]
ELGGDAAVYFDPISVDEMSASITRVLRDESLREEMRSRGLAQASRFSWKRAARETMEVYDRVLD